MSYHTERVAIRRMVIVAAAASWPWGAMAYQDKTQTQQAQPRQKQGDAQKKHAHPANHQRQGRRKPLRQPEGDPQRSEPPPQTKPAGGTGENDPPHGPDGREKRKGRPTPHATPKGAQSTRQTDPEGRPKAATNHPLNGKDAPHTATPKERSANESTSPAKPAGGRRRGHTTPPPTTGETQKGPRQPPPPPTRRGAQRRTHNPRHTDQTERRRGKGPQSGFKSDIPQFASRSYSREKKGDRCIRDLVGLFLQAIKSLLEAGAPIGEWIAQLLGASSEAMAPFGLLQIHPILFRNPTIAHIREV